MGKGIFPQRSIKTRVTLFTLSIFVVSVLALGLYGRSMIHRVVRELLGQQQLATVSTVAATVAQEFDERRRAIDTLANDLNPAIMREPAALRRLLERRRGWLRQFNAGTFIVQADGTATVASPPPHGIDVADIRNWDFIGSALRDGKTTIGLAHATPKLTIGLASPLRDARGRVIGVLLGLCDASQSNSLRSFVADSPVGGNAYHLLSVPHRQLISGSDGAVHALPAPGAVPLFDRFIEGHEGSGELGDFQGVAVLASAKRIPATDWLVLLTLPIENAVAPFRAERKYLLLGTLIVCLLASAAIWLVLRRELTPMLSTVKTLASLTTSRQAPKLLPVPDQHEIAELIVAFNGLLSTLVEREGTLEAAQAELRIAATAFESHQGMVVTDAQGVIQRVNTAFCETTGYSAEEAIGQTPKLLKSGRHDDDFYRAMWTTLLRTGAWQGEIWDRRKNGEIYPKWLTISRVDDPNGKVTHYVGAHFDITDRKQRENTIHQLAFYDPLTQLPNRRLLSDRLEQAIAAGKRAASHGALMFLDLDNFKSLNDRHGHIAGDLLLIEAANRLRDCVREVDTVARFGGDEFVVLLSEQGSDRAESAAHAHIVAEKIRAALSAPYILQLRHPGLADTLVEHRCSASIGVVLIDTGAASPDELLRRGDAAMYKAKSAGRNAIHLSDFEATHKADEACDKVMTGVAAPTSTMS